MTPRGGRPPMLAPLLVAAALLATPALGGPCGPCPVPVQRILAAAVAAVHAGVHLVLCEVPGLVWDTCTEESPSGVRALPRA